LVKAERWKFFFKTGAKESATKVTRTNTSNGAISIIVLVRFQCVFVCSVFEQGGVHGKNERYEFRFVQKVSKL
jgi:hypothetical protein